MTEIPVTITTAPVIEVTVNPDDVSLDLVTTALEIPVSVIAAESSSTSSVGAYVAAETMNGHRAVMFDSMSRLAPADSAAGDIAIGLIRDAVSIGNTVRLYQDGLMGGFTGLIPGRLYYLAPDGAISLTAPTAGTWQTLGTAATATELLIDLSLAIGQ